MRSSLCLPAFLLTVSLFAYSGLPGSVWGQASQSLAVTPTAARSSEEAPAASSAVVTVPSPLRSFLRMAAISQKVSPQEVLPLLARNVVVEGYQNAQNKSRQPTEFLILLKRYMEQAKELLALAGQEGVIRLNSCAEAQPLLTVLGYRLRQACGPETSLETADPQRAFLTIDSGFPLAELEERLRDGKPFVHPFPASQVPVLFSPGDWTGSDKTKDNQEPDLIDTLIRDPGLARLYWALSRLDAKTAAFLRQTPGLAKLVPLAPVLDFYGSHICIRSGRVVVPGGAPAESAWKDLVGVGADSPGEFVIRLLSKDEGWLAAYFDALSRVSGTQQAYFTEARRLPRFYEALRGQDPSPSPARPVFRPNPGLLLLVTRLQLEPSGQPHVPGNLEVWKEILRRKSDSKLVRDWAKRASRWNTPEQLVEGMFALSRVNSKDGPLELYLALSEMDRGRSAEQRLSPATARLLGGNFLRFRNQYLIFSEFRALNNASITRFLSVAEALDRIPDRVVRANALGVFQANVGLWQILARQEQIPLANWNDSWQQVINPFATVLTSTQLFDAGRSSLRELWRAATGNPDLSQDEIMALLAGPPQSSVEGRQVRQEMANRIRLVLEAQRLVSLDTLLVLGEGLNQMAQGKAMADSLIRLAGELREFEMPKPLFTTRERSEWASGLYNNQHTQTQMRTDLAKIIKSPGSPRELAEARAQLVPFLRDTLVGLNYAYYEPPGAQMIHNNPLFVRSHDFSGEATEGGEQSWQTPRLYGRGWTASGGAHLAGSLADLPYVLAQVEQDFIVPENVQSLIWADLVPGLMTSAVLPRWWRVTPNELHAVALYQRSGEELFTASTDNDQLRQKVMDILSDRMLPQRSEQVEETLRAGGREEALSLLLPAESFYLAAEFRRRFPEETSQWGSAGQDLESLVRRYPEEAGWERLSRDFGVPHPALAQSYSRELLNGKPFPTFLGYSSRLLAESWDSNNLYWARLADEMGYSPVRLHSLVPELTHRMVEKIFATHLEDWPAMMRALRETGDEFRVGKIAALPKRSAAAGF
jgi:hypothetical protein